MKTKKEIYSSIERYKRIVITGGSGFIGGNLISKLLKNTNCEIFNIDKMGYASDETLIKKSLNEKNSHRYKLLKIDLFDSKLIDEAIKKIKPYLVMHLAAESHVDRSIDGPKIFIEVILLGHLIYFRAVSVITILRLLIKKIIFVFIILALMKYLEV